MNREYLKQVIVDQKETYLNKSECNKYDIFRCAQSVASIYVSERIKKMVEENNWVGFAFYEQQ